MADLKAANDNDGPLGRIYTLKEAAAYLRMTTIALGKIARRTGHCSVHGRDLLFSDNDVLAIWEDLRCEQKAASDSSNGLIQTVGTFAVRPAAKTSSPLLDQAIEELLKPSSPRKRRAS